MAIFFRAILCISAAYAVVRSVCPCVCSSVTFVDHVKTNKRILKIYSPSGSPTILVCPHQTSWHYSDGDHTKGGVECKGGYEKMTIIDQYLALSPKWC